MMRKILFAAIATLLVAFGNLAAASAATCLCNPAQTQVSVPYPYDIPGG